MVPSQVRGMILQVPRQLDRGVRVTEPQLVQVRCPKCGRLGALANAPPAPPTWRCNGCRGRGDPEGCRNARRAVAAYRSGHYWGGGNLEIYAAVGHQERHGEWGNGATCVRL